jgi:hypothetical protein
MSHDELIIDLKNSDTAFAKLREFGSSLKPVDEKTHGSFKLFLNY